MKKKPVIIVDNIKKNLKIGLFSSFCWSQQKQFLIELQHTL